MDVFSLHVEAVRPNFVLVPLNFSAKTTCATRKKSYTEALHIHKEHTLYQLLIYQLLLLKRSQINIFKSSYSAPFFFNESKNYF